MRRSDRRARPSTRCGFGGGAAQRPAAQQGAGRQGERPGFAGPAPTPRQVGLSPCFRWRRVRFCGRDRPTTRRRSRVTYSSRYNPVPTSFRAALRCPSAVSWNTLPPGEWDTDRFRPESGRLGPNCLRAATGWGSGHLLVCICIVAAGAAQKGQDMLISLGALTSIRRAGPKGPPAGWFVGGGASIFRRCRKKLGPGDCGGVARPP